MDADPCPHTPRTVPYTSHDHYFETVPVPQRVRLQHIQALVESLVPGAERCISYDMPAFRLERSFVYFAAFKHHIGVYPPVTADAALVEATAAYRGPKGNLRFPNDRELPLALLRRVIVALAAQYGAR